MKMFQHIFSLILTFAVTIILAICSGYATHAAASLEDEKSAHSILTASSIIGWVTIALTIVTFISMIVFPEEILLNPMLRAGVTSLIYIVLFATLLVGILMAYAASVIHGSINYSDNKSEYTYATNGAIIGLVCSGSLLLLYGGIKGYEYYKGKHHETKQNVGMKYTSGFGSDLYKAGSRAAISGGLKYLGV